MLSRRAFLQAAAGLGLAALTPTPPAHPLTPATREPRVCFAPAGDYHELPPGCYADNLIRPGEVILHWDGNRQARDLWKVAITYETLALLQQSSHFAVDEQRVWQLLPMYQTLVQESYGAKGYNWIAINVEMAGRDFDQPAFAPTEAHVQRTLRLVAQLLDYYHLSLGQVYGHFERDDRHLKDDPGPQFMAAFRARLRAYQAARTPARQRLISDP